MFTHWFSAVVFAANLTSCAANKVPIIGADPDVAGLTGNWTGAYSSVESGRHGDIQFSLESGADSATGLVVMIPHSGHAVMAPIDEPYQRDVDERFLAEGLAIKFVQVGPQRVFGELAPYRDPDCGCQLETTFDGEIKGDVIEGTYRSIHLGAGRTVSGRWRVERRS